MPGYANALAFSSTATHACGVVDGVLWCWGSDDKGQLGDGKMTQQLLPVLALGVTEPVRAVAVGGHHTCAVTTAGGVLCWGSNSFGQLGTGTTGNFELVPQLVR